MVTTERSAPSAWEEWPSILAQLREWSAKHPLRPADGSPPALCDSDEIPIIWAQQPSQQVRLWFRRAPRDAEEELAVDAVVSALEQMTACPGSTTETANVYLYQMALGVERPAFGVILSRLRERKLRASAIRAFARWLLANAVHGEAVELGIFLSGATRDYEAIPNLSTFAWHPQFWRIAVFTLDFFQADTVDLHWAYADRVRCGERRRVFLQIASRLSNRPDVRDWILRHGSGGCDLGSVAAACAIAGDLAGALDAPDLADELLDAARVLVSNLVRDVGIETYSNGVLAVTRLVDHLLDRCATLRQLDLVHEIGVWLEWPTEQPTFRRPRRRNVQEAEAASYAATVWERREALGWTYDVRARLTDDCLRILRRPHWPAQVREAFEVYEPMMKDNLDRWDDTSMAWGLAPVLGVDLWEDGFRLLEGHPLDGWLTRALLDTDDPERVQRVVRLCERTIPPAIRASALYGLDTLPFTPTLGLFHRVLLAMARHAVASERLTPLALRCGGEARALATCVLDRTPPEAWGEEVVAALHLVSGFEAHENAYECRPHLLERLKRLDPDRWPT